MLYYASNYNVYWLYQYLYLNIEVNSIQDWNEKPADIELSLYIDLINYHNVLLWYKKKKNPLAKLD